MRVTVIPIVHGAFRTVPKGLEMRMEDLKVRGRIKTLHKAALLRSARVLRRVLKTCGYLLPLRLK